MWTWMAKLSFLYLLCKSLYSTHLWADTVKCFAQGHLKHISCWYQRWKKKNPSCSTLDGCECSFRSDHSGGSEINQRCVDKDVSVWAAAAVDYLAEKAALVRRLSPAALHLAAPLVPSCPAMLLYWPTAAVQSLVTNKLYISWSRQFMFQQFNAAHGKLQRQDFSYWGERKSWLVTR